MKLTFKMGLFRTNTQAHTFRSTSILVYYVIALLTLINGLPNMKEDQDSVSRTKRSTQQEHTNIVNVFLSELENNQNNKDVVFILDRSFAVGRKIFYLHERKLLSRMIRQYFATKPGNYNIAVITFGRNVTTAIDYISQNTGSVLKCDLVEKTRILDQVQYREGSQSEDGINIREAYRTALNILRNSKNPTNKQLIVVMTAAQFKDADVPSVELGELYLVPVFGVGIGHEFTDERMRQATHYYANFTYWKERTKSTDYHIAYLKYPEYYPYPNGCQCGKHGSCHCDVITGYSKCLCDKGYTMDGTGQCVACPQGFFKNSVGNEACERCPNEAALTLAPVAGTAYHTSCYCFNTIYNQWMQCPDHCRVDPFNPNADQYCTATRRCVRDQSLNNQHSLSFKCECLFGQTGLFCNEDIQECYPSSCINGGQCVEGHTQVACVCKWGFTGKLCEKKVDECSNSNACPQKSSCHQRVENSYECVCDRGHSDSACIHEDCLFKECGPNGTVIESKANPNMEESKDDEGTFSGTTKLIVIIMPPAAAVVVIFVISVAALIHVRRKGRGKEKDTSCMTETTSVISRNPSLITFDSKCYQDEGTPAVPNVAANFYDFDDSVYGNEPLQKGMDEWYAYVLAIVHNNNFSRLTIVRLDGEKWVLSPGCRLSLTETKTVFNILSNKVYSKVVTIQGRDFGIASNEDFVIVAHSIGKDGLEQEIACATKTRQFVITATALFQGDNGKCRQEIVKIRDHIKQQGL